MADHGRVVGRLVEPSIDHRALASKWSWQKRTMEAWLSIIFTWIKGKAPMLALYIGRKLNPLFLSQWDLTS